MNTVYKDWSSPPDWYTDAMAHQANLLVYQGTTLSHIVCTCGWHGTQCEFDQHRGLGQLPSSADIFKPYFNPGS